MSLRKFVTAIFDLPRGAPQFGFEPATSGKSLGNGRETSGVHWKGVGDETRR
jgi:hypothetical protein